MKILRHVLCLLLLLMFNTCGQAATKVGELYVPLVPVHLRQSLSFI